MNTCCLCTAVGSAATSPSWDRAIAESSNFVAVPSLGSLLEGWLLLVPKKHVISMGALPIALVPEMEQMKRILTEELKIRFGNVCVFEHGPAQVNRKVGCSVDHAHLHLVPLSFDLGQAALPFLPEDTEWLPGSWNHCEAAHRTGRDYLYFEQPVGQGKIATTRLEFGSQVFRKAIASALGRPHQYNWREYPEVDTVARTIDALVPMGTAASFQAISRDQ